VVLNVLDNNIALFITKVDSIYCFDNESPTPHWLLWENICNSP